MGNFIRRFFLFLVPVAIYMLVVVFVDPYNYFNLAKGIVNPELKKNVSKNISNPLYELVEFEREPLPNILLGSSQTGLLTSELINEVSGRKFSNMSYGGGTLPELITTFWELERNSDLKEVYIGISFIDFNGSQYRNRIPEALKIKSSPLTYIFSKSTLRSTLLIGKSLLLNSPADIGKPNMTASAFWKYQLDETANRFYANHSYPTEYYSSLKEISTYCTLHKIRLVFFIPPSHIELQAKVREFHFEQEADEFRDNLRKLGDVYDFDFPNKLTSDGKLFSDPFHVTHEGARIVTTSLFGRPDSQVTHFMPGTEVVISNNAR
jgi:hypothetical protein